MNEYASYEALKTYLGISTTGDDDLLRDFCTDASRAFDALCHRTFYPRYESRYFDHPTNAYVLRVDDDLLEVTTLTTDNGDETIAAADYFLQCGTSYNVRPYDRIVIDEEGSELFEWNDTPQRANTVTGTWGFHDDWDNAWQDSGDTITNLAPFTATETSLGVTDADGADIYGISPRFMVQQTLKIGSEYLYVTAKDTATNILTVRRGINGTTAAAHDNGTAIYIYQPVDAIAEAVKRWAAYLYRQKDSGIFETTIVPDMGTIVTPESIPKRVQLMLNKYIRRRGYSK